MRSILKTFAKLAWQTHFVSHLPGDAEKKNFTRKVAKIAYSEVKPTPVSQPKLLGWSDALAKDLGISKPTADDVLSLDLLSGNAVLDTMKPYAARYGGHQFGNWAGQLGDGRAISLGEAQTEQGRLEFQLKGAGMTPYSRHADGRAVLRSSLREFLCSEAMHFLGVPTTRALSLVLTGDAVIRDLFYDGNPAPEPGAIVCRVSPSFLRLGNFEILAASEEFDLLQQLTDYLIETHYPEISLSAADPYGKLLDEVCRRTAVMIAHWMRLGFVHGVMNTDNLSVLGLTIDYGPYGWLEPYEPEWTPNTTDAEGKRYSYGRQPNIALWNLARFAEALGPLVQKQERLHESLRIYQVTFGKTYGEMFAQKLGISSLGPESNQKLVTTLFENLSAVETDFTIFFRRLSEFKMFDAPEQFLPILEAAWYTPERLSPELKTKWLEWAKLYSTVLTSEGSIDEMRQERMNLINPKYVLRNYLAQNAILAAEKGDDSVLARLLRVLQNPYAEQNGEEDLAQKRPEWARNAPGCSALSCSS